jgi:hypothetical protein
MAQTKRVQFDAKALSEELGATVKEGRVTETRGRFYLTVGKNKLEIPLGGIVTSGQVKRLTGKIIPVIVSGGQIIVIGNPVGPGCYRIICYKPAPDFAKEISEVIRLEAIEKFVEAGVLTKSIAEKLKAAPGSAVLVR